MKNYVSHVKEFGTFSMCNSNLLNNFIMAWCVIFGKITMTQTLGTGEGRQGEKLGEYYNGPT